MATAQAERPVERKQALSAEDGSTSELNPRAKKNILESLITLLYRIVSRAHDTILRSQFTTHTHTEKSPMRPRQIITQSPAFKQTHPVIRNIHTQF